MILFKLQIFLKNETAKIKKEINYKIENNVVAISNPSKLNDKVTQVVVWHGVGGHDIQSLSEVDFTHRSVVQKLADELIAIAWAIYFLITRTLKGTVASCLGKREEYYCKLYTNKFKN